MDLVPSEPLVDLSHWKSASRVITNCLKTSFEYGCGTNPVTLHLVEHPQDTMHGETLAFGFSS
jgi:hypothetical protein